MPTPDDALDVIRALRLGWYIAEVRGRNWPAGPQPPGTRFPAAITLILGGSATRHSRRSSAWWAASACRPPVSRPGSSSQHARAAEEAPAQDAYTDLVASAVAEAPGKPGARSSRRAIVAEVRKRNSTTVADASVPG